MNTEIVFSPAEGTSEGTSEGASGGTSGGADGRGFDLAVCDGNTRPYVPEGVPAEAVVELPAGEQAKGWESVERILRAAVSRGLDRSSQFLGVGGGVITDLTAFAASVYMRGAGLALKPTTLLAMVDASFGGKTGFDFCGYKNLVGTFYPADTLLIDAAVLESLPERDFRGGLAEAVKTAMLGDEPLLALLEERTEAVLARDAALLEEIVRRCLTVKGRVVQEDLREKGGRAVLNLGHTFAHALESVSGFSWSHGEAVSWGLVQALRFSGALLQEVPPGFERGYAARIERLLVRLGLPVRAEGADPEALWEAVSHDKKRRGGKVRLVLQSGPGATRRDIPVDRERFLGLLRGSPA